MKPVGNRVLYTGDCNYLCVHHYGRWAQGRYTARVLHDHVDLLADSGVDTCVVNPNGQVAWYPSGALPHVLHVSLRAYTIIVLLPGLAINRSGTPGSA